MIRITKTKDGEIKVNDKQVSYDDQGLCKDCECLDFTEMKAAKDFVCKLAEGKKIKSSTYPGEKS